MDCGQGGVRGLELPAGGKPTAGQPDDGATKAEAGTGPGEISP